MKKAIADCSALYQIIGLEWNKMLHAFTHVNKHIKQLFGENVHTIFILACQGKIRNTKGGTNWPLGFGVHYEKNG